MELEFRATGTTWWLSSESASPSLLGYAEDLVRSYEQRLSRFLPQSAVSYLNCDRAVDDAVVADVLRVAERVKLATAGAFDVSAGAAVVAAGYDRPFDELRGGSTAVAVDSRRPEVVVTGSQVRVCGEGVVDLGGIAKGWIVDRAAELLAVAGPCLVDGGGDIRVCGAPEAGEWLLGAGDGLAVGLVDAAIATSSSLKRRWSMGGEPAHHIVDPDRGEPATGSVTTAVVLAADTAMADALATALIVDLSRGLRGVVLSGAEALVGREDGTWEMTLGFGRHLR
jgi:thiamine biosynthesis lipoprotein